MPTALVPGAWPRPLRSRGMASIERVTRDGRTAGWRARWRDPAGVQRKKAFARKADAERFRVGVEASKATGAYIDHGDRTTVAEYARAWAAARPHRPSTARRVRGVIETHVAATGLGGRRLADVRPSEVQAWATDRAEHLAPSTLRLLLSVLCSVFASAVHDRLIASSPVVRIALPRHEKPRVVPLTVEQVSELATAMPARNRAMVVAQAGLGLRVGELLALRAQDVDFLRRAVRVEHQLAEGRVRSDPKAPRSRRTVPLPSAVGDALAAHMAAFPPGADGSLFTTGPAASTGTTTTGRASSRRPSAEPGCRPGPPPTTCATNTPPCCWPPASRSWRSRSGSATRTPTSSCRPTATWCRGRRTAPGRPSTARGPRPMCPWCALRPPPQAADLRKRAQNHE